MLTEKVPPFSDNRLVHDLCEEVIEAFSSVYPDKALNVCMRLAHRISAGGEATEPGRGYQSEKKQRRRNVSKQL